MFSVVRFIIRPFLTILAGNRFDARSGTAGHRRASEGAISGELGSFPIGPAGAVGLIPRRRSPVASRPTPSALRAGSDRAALIRSSRGGDRPCLSPGPGKTRTVGTLSTRRTRTDQAPEPEQIPPPLVAASDGRAQAADAGAIEGGLAPSGDSASPSRSAESAYDLGHAIASDRDGNAYVTGYFSGTADFDPAGTPVTLSSVNGAGRLFVRQVRRRGPTALGPRWIPGPTAPPTGAPASPSMARATSM